MKKKRTKLLAKQSLRKRKSKSKKNRFYIIGVFFVALFAVGYFLYSKEIKTSLTSSLGSKHSSPNYQIIIKPDGNTPLPQKIRSRIIRKAQKTIKENPDNLMLAVARAIEKNSNFSRVHVLNYGHNKLVISVFKRKPFLAVKADTLRYLTKDGDVFGRIRDDDNQGLVPLYGVFPKSKTNYRFNDDNSLFINNVQKSLLLEAVDLLSYTKKNKLSLVSMRFEKFRGFFVKLKQNGIEVSFGRKPFDKKVKRLGKILKNLKNKGIISTQIELDYEGKAFIKEANF